MHCVCVGCVGVFVRLAGNKCRECLYARRAHTPQIFESVNTCMCGVYVYTNMSAHLKLVVVDVGIQDVVRVGRRARLGDHPVLRHRIPELFTEKLVDE